MAPTGIREYFKGKTIFITGGSGFVGKTLIEKLVRVLEVEKIYVLLRPKKGKMIDDRLANILSSPLFRVVKEENPEALQKLIPINGDITEDLLGLSEIDRNTLINEVNIVYHVAASVKFDDFLKDAIRTNIKSTRETAALALKMKNIEVFNHVSTAYCNIEDRLDVEEKLYPPHGDWQEAIEMADKFDNEQFNILSQKYTEKFPNTYTFTKRLAEHCVNDMLVGKIATVICRPSVVICTNKEPFEGFVDNLNGPVGLLLAGGVGLLRTVYGNGSIQADLNFVDNLINIMLASTWHKFYENSKDKISIYHISRGLLTIFTNDQMTKMGKSLYWEVPFEKKIWFPRNSFTNSWYLFFINVLLFHLIPALVIDLLLKLFGQKTFLLKLQRKIYVANMAVSPFIEIPWNFRNDNCEHLMQELIPQDEKSQFYEYIPKSQSEIYHLYLVSCDYARRNLLHEKGDIKEETRRRTKMMYFADVGVKFLFFAWVFWKLFFKINILKLLLNYLTDYWTSLPVAV